MSLLVYPNPTKEIEYNGQIERYEIVDGYLEMFVGYVSTCRQQAAPIEHPALKAERDARLSPKHNSCKAATPLRGNPPK